VLWGAGTEVTARGAGRREAYRGGDGRRRRRRQGDRRRGGPAVAGGGCERVASHKDVWRAADDAEPARRAGCSRCPSVSGRGRN